MLNPKMDQKDRIMANPGAAQGFGPKRTPPKKKATPMLDKYKLQKGMR